MDSLLASYASSDEEEDPQQQPSSKFVETPKSSSLLSSLPPPKPNNPILQNNLSSSSNQKPKSSSMFSSLLPPPKSNNPILQNPTNISSSSHQKPKKVVQFRPPMNPSLLKTLDDDDEEEEEEKSRKPTKVSNSSTETSSVKSFLSFLPAPKSSLALGSGSSLGSGRKSIVETSVSPSSNYNEIKVEKKSELVKEEKFGDVEGNLVGGSSSLTSETLVSVGDASNWVSSNESYGSYENYGNYVNYDNSYGSYEGNYGNYGGSTEMAPPTIMAAEISGAVENVVRLQGKRGRSEIPTEIIEVKQDELMKNRPREDQVKMTGIAFGPAYQPASSKGKPSKLHKRKHQIGSLYFDMRQKETELAERRSKGFLTKAETQAKYGW